jgi:hypothetical protein
MPCPGSGNPLPGLRFSKPSSRQVRLARPPHLAQRRIAKADGIPQLLPFASTDMSQPDDGSARGLGILFIVSDKQRRQRALSGMLEHEVADLAPEGAIKLAEGLI